MYKTNLYNTDPNVLRPLELVQNQAPTRRDFWLPNKTQSLPDLSNRSHEANEKILESAIKMQ